MAQLAGKRSVFDLLQTSQQRTISTGILTFALLVALLWGSFRPTIITIIETNRKYAQKEALLQKLDTQNTNLATLLLDQLQEEEKLSALDYYFPSNGDYSLFVINLNQTAKKYSLLMNSVSFSSSYFRQVEKITALQFPEMIPMTFQVSLVGDPSRLGSFLSYLESMPFQPKVLSVSYAPNKTDTSKTALSVTLLLYKMTGPAIPE